MQEDESKNYLKELIELEKSTNPIMIFPTFMEARSFMYSFKGNPYPFGSDVRIMEVDTGFIIALKSLQEVKPGPYNPMTWLIQGKLLFIRLNGLLS